MPDNPEMRLTMVADLVGVNVSGLKADIRSRLSDGSRKHECVANDPLQIVTMKRVCFKTKNLGYTLFKEYGKNKGRWLYWYWETKDLPNPYNCGYSGVIAEDDSHLENYILIEDYRERQ